MMQANYDYVKGRWLAYWNRENHDRPIMSIHAPLGKNTLPDFTVPENISDRWLDAEFAVKNARYAIENTYYAGEALPVYSPNLGPDLIGAVCGCDIKFGESTSWAVHNVENWDAFPEIKLDENNVWWKKIKELTQAAAADAKGDYLVGITDLHPGPDGLVSLRGPENLCIDLVENPEALAKRTGEMFNVYKKMYTGLDEIISPYQEGTVNWMGIWHPEAKWYVLSCDFSCLISRDDFNGLVVPGLLNEMEFLENNMYHLDGPDALHHVDSLLALEKLNGIQWVYGAGQPSARHWLPLLKKIQNAGKCIQVYCEPEDLEEVCEALNPEGLNLVAYVADKQTADDMIKTAEKIYTQKRQGKA